MQKSIFFLSVCIGTYTFVFGQFTDFKIVKEVKVKNKSVIVSAHPLASEAGISVINDGGNAFDASIAVQYALAVVYPQAGNIGGGGFMVATTNKGEKLALDFRETAPAKSHKDMFLDEKGNANTSLSQNGCLSVGVPGTISAMYEIHKYANLPMEKLIQPAIDLAEKGFSISLAEADLLNANRQKFLEYNKTPIPFVKEIPWKEGDILVQKDLAETLKRIQKHGKRDFYEGLTAKLITDEITLGNGIMSMEDLKNYKVKYRTPLTFNYKGNEIVSMPLPSSGGILLGQMLTMVGLVGLDGKEINSPQSVQLMVEAERRAFADRAKYMGDPDFIEDKSMFLISKKYLKQRFYNYNPALATPSSEVGEVVIPQRESTQTTHISILDSEGNAISVTTTLNGYYGSKTMVSGAGFFLNNEMDDFSIKPGIPNMYGAVGGNANAIAPNKRMLSSMTPTIVLKNKKPFIVVGTPGGTTIPTSVFQSIVGIIDFKVSPGEVVNSPKFHHQWLPEIILVEKNFPEYVIKNLEQKNYKFEKRDKIGRVEMIVVDENNNYHAVADGRGDDSVAIGD